MESVLPLGLGITHLVEKVGRELNMEGHKGSAQVERKQETRHVKSDDRLKQKQKSQKFRQNWDTKQISLVEIMI